VRERWDAHIERSLPERDVQVARDRFRSRHADDRASAIGVIVSQIAIWRRLEDAIAHAGSIGISLLAASLTLLALLARLTRLTGLARNASCGRRSTGKGFGTESRSNWAAVRVLDVEVEVHADELKEVVADGDEPHLDGDLQ